MRNMSNASPYFRKLLLSKQIHFLLPDVLKPLSEHFEKEESKDVDQENSSNVLKCRLVCKSWSKSIDKFIQDISQPKFFNVKPSSPNKGALANAKCTYFGENSWKLDEFMAHFEQTHSPIDHPERSPFIGHLVVIHKPENPYFNDEMKNQVTTLLRHYGRHIRILNIRLSFVSVAPDLLWFAECLSLVPNLTHLKACTFWSETDRQLWEEPFHHPPPMEQGDEPMDWMDLLYEAGGEEAINFEEPNHVNMEASPLPKLTSLILCGLRPASFNHLVEAYRHVECLHINKGNPRPRDDYVDWRQLEFPNLKKFYLKLRSPAEVRELWYLDRSRWANVTHVHLDYSWKADFYEWFKLFAIIREFWGNTLIELKLRLPKPTNFVERSQAMRDSGTRDAAGYTLTLPKLKSLKIWIWKSKKFHVKNLKFLDSVMQQPGLEFKRYSCDEDH